MLAALAPALTDQLTLHHAVYLAPAKADQLEELISAALHRLGFLNDWKPGSHTVSTDITLTSSGATLSVKSGTISNGSLTISGSRLGTSSSSLDSMLEVVKKSTAQFYLCVARKDADWKPQPDGTADRKYWLLVFPSALLDYGGASAWTQRTTKNGSVVYEYSPEHAVIQEASIRASMSHQLWTRIDLAKLTGGVQLVIPPQLDTTGHQADNTPADWLNTAVVAGDADPETERDESLDTSEAITAERRPNGVFVATGILPKGDGFALCGDLTIDGATYRVELGIGLTFEGIATIL